MFRSEKLVRITVQVPEAFISAATAVLARFRLLHLIRIDQTHLGRLGYVAEHDETLIQEMEHAMEGIQSLLDSLAIAADLSPIPESVIPEQEIYRIRERLEEIRKSVGSILGDFQEMEHRHGRLQALLASLERLPPELDITRLSACVFVDWTIGLISARGIDRLEESLSRVHHAVVELNRIPDCSVILVFGLKPDWEQFEEALKGALFEPVQLENGFSGTVADILSDLRSQQEDLAERRREILAARSGLQERFKRELLELFRKIRSARQILAARRLFGKVDHSFLISGWVPERLLDDLTRDLSNQTDRNVLIETVNPTDLREVRDGIIKIPILFNNPLLISPFEKLTSLYGTPKYGEVEPTVFFALSFLLLFGMMFGDVGQGGVLFLAGYLIFRRMYRFMDYGIILMECGFFSMFFGFLYGSIFGLESLIPALWFRPMENIPYFVQVTLIVGAGMLSLGMILNVINAVRLKEYEKLFSAGGLGGALLYWMSAGLGLKYMITGRVAPGELAILGWVAGVLLVVMVLHRPIYRLITRRDSPRGIFRRSTLGAELIESVVEVFDDLIRFVANTVSFIRVAAFALSHAALFIAVFSIAEIVSQEKSGSFSYWFVVVIGNVIIILLEGLVVSIQTVRLEYYEFYGRFFRGGGERFQPFEDTNNGSSK